MEPFSALLAVCEGNSPVISEFPAQRPVTRSFDVFFYLRLNKRLNNQDNTRVILYSVHASLCVALGWGLLSQFPPFRYFPNFSALSKQTLAIEYHVYIWQVSPQLSCGDTCQIWMWFEKSYMYFCHIENFAYGENNERSFSNPHPWLCTNNFLMASRTTSTAMGNHTNQTR